MNLSAAEIKSGRRIIATGNTFAAKTELKAIGGRWSEIEQGWVIPCPSGSGDCARIASATYKLAKAGVRFEVER